MSEFEWVDLGLGNNAKCNEQGSIIKFDYVTFL